MATAYRATRRTLTEVQVRFRRASGDEAVCGLDRLPADDVLVGRPVRDFRWYIGRQFYSAWYWGATTAGLVAYESRLELARILLADFDPTVTGFAAQPFQAPDRPAAHPQVPSPAVTSTKAREPADVGVMV